MDPIRLAQIRKAILEKKNAEASSSTIRTIEPPPVELDSFNLICTSDIPRNSEVEVGNKAPTPGKSKSMPQKQKGKRKRRSDQAEDRDAYVIVHEPTDTSCFEMTSMNTLSRADLPQSLWYQNVDATPWMRSQLVSSVDRQKNQSYLAKHGEGQALRFAAIQLGRALGTILETIPDVEKNDRDALRLELDSAKKDLELMKKELETKSIKLNDWNKAMLDLQEKFKSEQWLHLSLKKEKEEKDALLNTFRQKELEWEKKLNDKEEETQQLKQQVRELDKKLLSAQADYWLLFHSGFKEAVRQIKHFNPSLLIDTSKTDKDSTLEDLIRKHEGNAP